MKKLRPSKTLINLNFITLVIFGTSLFFASCSKSKDTPTPTTSADEETPFQTAVHDATIVNLKAAYGQTGGAEIGYRVHFSKGGTITKLGANMATNGTYTVSFWRTADATLLGRASVKVADTSKFAYAAITTITVKPDTAYSVSIHIPDGSKQNHWVYYWTPFRDMYPFTEGHVIADQVLDLAYLPTDAAPSYPYPVYSSDQGYIGSSCDFVYIASK